MTPKPSDQRVFVADGHDVASSLLSAQRGEKGHWTINGEPLVEGERYVKVWVERFRMVRGSYGSNGRWKELKFKGGWELLGRDEPTRAEIREREAEDRYDQDRDEGAR